MLVYKVFLLYIQFTAPVPCSNAIDLAILLDASHSLSNLRFRQLKQFVFALAKNFDLSGGTRLGLITFNNKARLLLAFDETGKQNLEHLEKTLSKERLGKNTRIDLALQEAYNKLFKQTGSQDNNAKVVILLTDGRSSPRVKDYKPFVEPLKV